MAETPKTKISTSSHVRSNSFPTTSNSLHLSFHQDLLPNLITILKHKEFSTPSTSFVCRKLRDINDLYESIDNSIKCHSIHQALLNETHRNGVEEILEGSINLLDVCSFIKDNVLSSMKESIVELRSYLRRNKIGGNEKCIDAYLLSRRKIQKMANKYGKNLQAIKMNLKNGENSTIHCLDMLKDVEALCLSSLGLVLGCFFGKKNDQNGWFIETIGKLMTHKNLYWNKSSQGNHVNELEKIDPLIFQLENNKKYLDVKLVQDLAKQLEQLQLAIGEIQECLEAISRCLTKIRVSLLNILSH